MVMKKGSEYQRAYRSEPVCNIVSRSYEDHLGYRINRRSTEHIHQQAPFAWDISDEVWESSDSDGNAEPARAPSRPKSVPLYQYKHQKYNEAYRARQQEAARKKRTKRVKDAACDPKTPTTAHIPESTRLDLNGMVSPDDILEKSFDKGVQVEDLPQKIPAKSSEKPKKGTYRADQSRPKKPVKGPHSQPVPKPRPLSAPLGRPVKKPVKPKDERPPFIPYGFRDREFETSKKLTHNIRASTDVYPAALRAAKRREALIENAIQEQKTAPMWEKRKIASFNDKMQRETSAWESEYRNNYAGYDNTIYKRNYSARQHPRMAWEALFA